MIEFAVGFALGALTGIGVLCIFLAWYLRSPQ